VGTQIPQASRAFVKARDFLRCVRCGCPAPNGHWHHRRGRSVVDEHQHATCNGINLCTLCHEWVHKNPFAARSFGWIVSRWAIPCAEPVYSLAHSGWVLLGHDGELEATDPPPSA
jgi:hypothetical protein